MSQRTALLTIAILLTFMSTTVVHSTAADSISDLTLASAKSKGSHNSQKHRRKHKAKPAKPGSNQNRK